MRHFLWAFVAVVLCLAAIMSGAASAAQEAAFEDFNCNWRFTAGKPTGAADPNLDDSQWEKVDLPHDWAISGPFGPHDARGDQGKLPWIGDGWYRKTFELPETAEDKRLIMIFDGVMALPTVYLNGNQMEFDSLTDDAHPLFYGKAVAVLRSQYNQSGTATLKVKVPEKGFESRIDISVTAKQENPP